MIVNESSNKHHWKLANNFQELCNLIALGIEEKNFFPPDFPFAIDTETKPLISFLSMYNRAGFLTENSQPGVSINTHGCGQRAFIDGFAMEKLARRIIALELYTDLLVFGYPPGYFCEWQIPVKTIDYYPSTWTGGKQVEYYQDYLYISNDSAIIELERAWQISIIDPKWGRKNYLWQNVAKIINTSPKDLPPYKISPHPELGIVDIYS